MSEFEIPASRFKIEPVVGDKNRWDSIIRKAQIFRPPAPQPNHPNFDQFILINGKSVRWALDMRLPLTDGDDLAFISEHIIWALKGGAFHVDANTGICGMSLSGALIVGAVIPRLPGVPACVWASIRKEPRGRDLVLFGSRPRNVILIDELISGGGGKRRAIADVERAGMNVAGVLCIVRYGHRTGFEELSKVTKCAALVHLREK